MGNFDDVEETRMVDIFLHFTCTYDLGHERALFGELYSDDEREALARHEIGEAMALTVEELNSYCPERIVGLRPTWHSGL